MIIEILKNDEVPFDLLYLADEDEAQIARYREKALFVGARREDREGHTPQDLGKIVGTLGLVIGDQGMAEIVSLAVYPNQENQGIGTRLVEKAIGHAKEQGCRSILVKTGNCGIKLFHIYQRCGFRFDHIVPDYFPRHYPRPIYENHIPCRDQIVFNYQIYSSEEQNQAIRAYWERFLSRHPEYKNRTYEAWYFGYGEVIPNQLIGLVKIGKKRGTSSALELYGPDEKVPEPGDLSILTYSNGLPGCIIETREVRRKTFREIGAEEARLEGEGDLSLSHWQQGHHYFFSLEYREAGLPFHHDIPVLFERFEVIYDEDNSSD